MPEHRDQGTSSSGKRAVPDDGRDALTVTHTPTTISFGPGVAAAGDVTLPRSIGNVTIQEEIGRGGMGVVFHGQDAVLHRAVAVKFLLAVATQEDDPLFNRFFGGARAEAAVKHPNIVTVYEAGRVSGVPYLVMEFIDGPSLHALLRSNRALPVSVAVKVLWDVAQAVGALHERDIIHRDLKPGNVLFDRTGHLFVTDFGLASLCRRLDDPAEAAGTPAYMAPETFDGRASPQSDVYAMGCMLFELLTGRLPFTGDAKSVRDQHSNAPLPVDQLPDSVPSSLVDVIERATHKQEVFRYRRAEQFQRALQASMATSELLQEGAAKLGTLVLTTHEGAPAESADLERDKPSTGTYFERLSELASKKRDTPTRLEGSEPSSERVDEESAGQVVDANVPIRRDPLRFDVTCATCGYNLRSLQPDSQCPECNTSVTASLQPDRLIFADPKWLSGVAKGLHVIQWSLGVSVAVLLGLDAATLLWNSSGKKFPGTRTVVHRFESSTWTASYNVFVDFAFWALLACSVAAIMTGVLLATRRPAMSTIIEKGRATRRASRVLAVVCALIALGPLICFDLVRTTVHKLPNGISVGPAEPVMYTILTVSTAIALMCLVPVFLRCLSHLLRRLPHAQLGHQSVIHGVLFPALIILALGVQASGSLWSQLRVFILGTSVINVIGIFALLVRTRRGLRRVIPNCVSYHEHFGGPVDASPERVLVAAPSVESGRSDSPGQEAHSPTERAARSPTHPAPTIQSPEMAPMPTLLADVPCMQCDYNLRGLTARGRCPECGATVVSSLRKDRLLFSEPSWLRQIVRGLTVLYAAVVATPVVFIVVVPASLFLFRGGPEWAVPARAGGVAGIVLIVGLFIGGFFATASEPRRRNRELPWSSRRLARTLGVLFPLTLAAVPLTANYSPALLNVSLGLMWAALLGMLVTFLLYLASLVDRSPNARLVRQARGLAIAVGAIPVLGAIAGVAGFGIESSAYPRLSWLLIVTCSICTLGCVATAGLYLGLIRVYRRVVVRVIADSVSLDTLFGNVPTEEVLAGAAAPESERDTAHSKATKGTLQADLPCAQCDYNLRGLSVGAQCPECGETVASSMGRDRLLFAEPSWLRQIVRGPTIIFWMICFWPVLALGTASFTNWTRNVQAKILTADAIETIVRIGFTALLAVGVLLTTRGEPRGSGRSINRIFLRAFAVIWMLSVIVSGIATGPNNPVIDSWPAFVSASIVLALIPSYLLYLAALADRIPDRRLARHSRLTIIPLGVLVVLVVPKLLPGASLSAAMHAMRITSPGGIPSWIPNLIVALSFAMFYLTVALLLLQTWHFRKALTRVISSGVPFDKLFERVAKGHRSET